MYRETREARLRVRVKTKIVPVCNRKASAPANRFFSSCGTMKSLVSRLRRWCRRARLRCAWAFSCSCWRFCTIASGIVAEKSMVWRSAGTSRKICLICGAKPMSSILSASSRTKVSTVRKSTLRCCKWSIRRPGVATMMSGLLRKSESCGRIGAPPMRIAVRSPNGLPTCFNASSTCSANSRVGKMMSARPRERLPFFTN